MDSSLDLAFNPQKDQNECKTDCSVLVLFHFISRYSYQKIESPNINWDWFWYFISSLRFKFLKSGNFTSTHTHFGFNIYIFFWKLVKIFGLVHLGLSEFGSWNFCASFYNFVFWGIEFCRGAFLDLFFSKLVFVNLILKAVGYRSLFLKRFSAIISVGVSK